MKRLHVFVSGRVQMVAFRYSTRSLARKLNISGWVRNLLDGRVEAVFEGEGENLKKIIDFCKRGPFLAKVIDIEVQEENVKGEKGFEIIR